MSRAGDEKPLPFRSAYGRDDQLYERLLDARAAVSDGWVSILLPDVSRLEGGNDDSALARSYPSISGDVKRCGFSEPRGPWDAGSLRRSSLL